MPFTDQDLIRLARGRLRDPRGESWPDARLHDLITEAFIDVSLNSELLEFSGYIPVYRGIAQYNLADTVLRLERVEYNHNPVEFRSHSWMDQHIDQWTKDTGAEPQYIVYTNQQPGNFTVYPIPDDSNAQQNITVPDFGIISGFGGDPITQIVDGLSDFGTIQFNPQTNRYLRVYYTRRYAPTNGTGSYALNDQYRKPLVYYITSEAMRDDEHSFNPQRAEQERKLYMEALESLNSERSSDFTGQRSVITSYRPMG